VAEPVDEQGADVSCVVERPLGDDPGEGRGDVVASCLGAAQFGCEWAEGVRGDDGGDLLGVEAGGLKFGYPSVVLGLGCDGEVFRRDLGEG
jgi:hypothetical protein